LTTGQAVVQLAYSEETSQVFWKDDIRLNVEPRLPNYEYQPVKRVRRAV